MHKLGMLSLELLFVGLLYTAVGVVTGVFSAGLGRPVDLLRLLLVDILVITPLVFFVWESRGSWWAVGGAATLALALLHVVVPRMELLLERHASVMHLPMVTMRAMGAGAAAVGALLMLLRPWRGRSAGTAYPWPAGAPLSYLWRIPAVVGCFAAIHFFGLLTGRALVGGAGVAFQRTDLFVRLAMGGLMASVALAIAACLKVRSRARRAVFLLILVAIPAIGRWHALLGWPFNFLCVRVGVRLACDLAAGLACASIILAAPRRSSTREALPVESQRESATQEEQDMEGADRLPKE